MVRKVNDVKQIVYLPKVLRKLSKKDSIIKEREVTGQIWKIASQKKHPRNNLPKIWVYTNHVTFLKELSRLQKLYFLLKEYMDGYFWLSLEKHFLQAFFPVFFPLLKEKIHREKNPRRNSVNENSRKFRRNTSLQEHWKNYAKCRQSQTYT